MSVTYGFYDSFNGDRVYNAEQFGSIFDGLLQDGIYSNILNKFAVNASNHMTVTVDTGRGWFNHTWILNDAPEPITIPAADAAQNRIDAVVIQIDKRISSRSNSFIVISGTPAVSPSRPSMDSGNESVFWYPLAYIYVGKGVTTITQGNITNVVGSQLPNGTPYIAAPLTRIDVAALTRQYRAQWEEFFEAETASDSQEFTTWMNQNMSEFRAWHEGLVDILGGDDPDVQNVAANLLAEIEKINDQINNNEFIGDLMTDDGDELVTDNVEQQDGPSDPDSGAWSSDEEAQYQIASQVSYIIQGSDEHLGGLFVSKTYTCEYSVPAETYISITKDMISESTPANYTPIAITRISTGSQYVDVSMFNPGASRTTALVRLYNHRNVAQNNITCTIGILYTKTVAF